MNAKNDLLLGKFYWMKMDGAIFQVYIYIHGQLQIDQNAKVPCVNNEKSCRRAPYITKKKLNQGRE